MNYSRFKLTLWALTLCVAFTITVAPVLAQTEAGSGATSSADTSKKSKKKSKKAKASADDQAAGSAPAASTPPANAGGAVPASPASAAAPKNTKVAASPASPDPEIAAAKSSGKVWVNLDSGIYHKGGRWYGKTKNGKFMTEAEAKAAGYKESQRN